MQESRKKFKKDRDFKLHRGILARYFKQFRNTNYVKRESFNDSEIKPDMKDEPRSCAPSCIQHLFLRPLRFRSQLTCCIADQVRL